MSPAAPAPRNPHRLLCVGGPLHADRRVLGRRDTALEFAEVERDGLAASYRTHTYVRWKPPVLGASKVPEPAPETAAHDSWVRARMHDDVLLYRGLTTQDARAQLAMYADALYRTRR